jgi:DHA3 family macrolide efflux protein-like MFS transporter
MGVGIILLLAARVPQPPIRASARAAGAQTMLHDIKEGFRFVLDWKGLTYILLVSALLNFFINPAMSLLPLFVVRDLGGQAIQLGSLESAMGAGIIFGGLVLGAWGGFRKRIYTSIMGVAGMGLGILVLANTPASAFFVAVAGMGLMGFMNPMGSGPLFAVLQSAVPPQIQGRVLSAIGAATGLATPIGLLLIAPLGDVIGVRGCFAISGAAFVVIAVAMRFVPAVMHMEDGAAAAAEAFRRPVRREAVAEADIHSPERVA